jgi:hypothetical protein
MIRPHNDKWDGLPFTLSLRGQQRALDGLVALEEEKHCSLTSSTTAVLHQC